MFDFVVSSSPFFVLFSLKPQLIPRLDAPASLITSTCLQDLSHSSPHWTRPYILLVSITSQRNKMTTCRQAVYMPQQEGGEEQGGGGRKRGEERGRMEEGMMAIGAAAGH